VSINDTRSLAALALLSLVTACGGGGGTGGEPVARSNAAPVVVQSIATQRVVEGRSVDVDIAQGGGTFVDTDGDNLTYALIGEPAGLTLSGTRIVGVPTGLGSFMIKVTASDGHGGVASMSFLVQVVANHPPIVARPNQYQFSRPGMTVSYDVTQVGTTFADDDGDQLVYEVSLLSPPQGLSVVGTTVTGSFDSVGVVRVKVTATDPSGAVAEDSLAFVAPADIADRPTLPAVPYVYADAELPLPAPYRQSSTGQIPFWDTTPIDNRTTDLGAAIGRVLFYDKRLSITNTVACASCHVQSLGFSGPERFNVGVEGVPLKRHAMSLTNVRYNIRDEYFSDMRARTLEQLVLMPIEEPTELGQPLDLLERKLIATDFYTELLLRYTGDATITRERIARFLAQFLRSLISYQTRFDRVYNDPNNGSLDPSTVFSDSELRGIGIYMSHCLPCHQSGVHAMFDPSNNGLDELPDQGVLGLAPGVFRSASLRNVGVSAPYMHDGRFATLREVIDHYDSGVKMSLNLSGLFRQRLPDGSEVPKRLNLTEQDKEDLEAFLNSLTDDAFLADPKLSDPFR
jgi:cytochrome c peroxidase